MSAVIYSLSDPRTGIVRYVGKTERSPEKRLTEHITESRRKRPRYPVAWWIRSLAEDGLKPILTILEEANDWEKSECFWITKFKSKNLLNCTVGGEGAVGYNHSHETRRKMSSYARSIGRKPPGNLGRIFSAKARANMSIAHKGKKGRQQSPETRAKISASRLAMGIKWTDEQRKRTITSRSNYIITPEHRANLSAAAKADWARRKAAGRVR